MPAYPYEKAADHTRPHGSHRYDVFGPKLGRSVALFGREALNAWTMIEADSSIISYCERPLILPRVLPKRVVDFWVRRKSGQEFWLLLRPSELDDNGAPTLSPGFHTWSTSGQHTIKLITPESLATSRQLLENWGWIIRDLSAFAKFVDKVFLDEVKIAVTDPVDLGRLECKFVERDPTLVRVAVFLLLHQGRALCHSLSAARIGPSTVIETA
ncbi:hypothetical protein LXA47_04270 [Massilia sp. P8910]|uniref:hypothetical protein n=1 Tax=Massilia antarctica TaxID=2765360 RepID=UPI001E2E07D7|nr:hypothetical protein [Massilia antarctica]MCE3602815.1 hypothetical protein [Massilia antarctica]